MRVETLINRVSEPQAGREEAVDRGLTPAPPSSVSPYVKAKGSCCERESSLVVDRKAETLNQIERAQSTYGGWPDVNARAGHARNASRCRLCGILLYFICTQQISTALDFLSHHLLPPVAASSSKNMLKSYSPRAAAWTAPEINMAADASFNFWQGKICTPLAILLRKAGYNLETQYAHMRFFLDCTVPALGPACSPPGSVLPWQSFMTDDHTPVELSWEWGHTGEDPRIRYALEPIGFSAGGCLDPLNLQASRNLIKELQHTVPNLNLRWYNHCAERLLPNNHAPDSQHAALLGKSLAETSSSSFIAYDLRRKGPMTVKAYFLPSVRATHSKVSNFDLIVQAIRSLPEARAGAFQALELLTEFTQKDPLGSALECDILGIDCVPEEYARLKIYLRSRCTSFDSVRSIMTLGGRIQSPENERAFRDLFELWQALFFPGKQQVTSTGGDLQPCAHRTAGVLYYFDFSKTKPKPVPKVYLPVRHYGKSDYLIATALCTYMKRRDKQQEARQYLSALEEIFTSRELENSLGAQTYIACAIKGGQLMITSYINPKIYSKPTTGN